MTDDLGWVLDAVKPHVDGRADCVFVGASIARGWGNPSSDIDVYVLGGFTDRGVIVAADLAAERPRIDIHHLSRDTLNQLFAKMDWESIEEIDYVNTVPEREWLLLERLHHAHVLAGHDAFRGYRHRLSETAHQHMLVQTHFARADSLAEDCLGQLEIDDLDSAVISGHMAYVRAIDGLLAARGCFSWNPKWRARAMRQAAPDDLIPFAEFWRVLTMADLGTRGHRGFALRCVADVRDVLARVDVLRFEGNE